MESQMIIRLDEKLKKSMYRLARNEGKTASQVVRELVANYIAERDMGAYINDLWTRTGSSLRKAGSSARDINRVIKQVRSSK